MHLPTNTALQQKTREKNTQPALQFEEKIILSNMVIYLRRHFAHNYIWGVENVCMSQWPCFILPDFCMKDYSTCCTLLPPHRISLALLKCTFYWHPDNHRKLVSCFSVVKDSCEEEKRSRKLQNRPIKPLLAVHYSASVFWARLPNEGCEAHMCWIHNIVEYSYSWGGIKIGNVRLCMVYI